MAMMLRKMFEVPPWMVYAGANNSARPQSRRELLGKADHPGVLQVAFTFRRQGLLQELADLGAQCALFRRQGELHERTCPRLRRFTSVRSDIANDARMER
jgi:hypothetical protein